MGDEKSPKSRKRKIGLDHLARDAVAAVDDVNVVPDDDRLSRGGAIFLGARPSPGSQKDESCLGLAFGRKRRKREGHGGARGTREESAA